MFGGGSIMVWGCFSHDLELKIVKQTLTGQRNIDDILEPIVHPHFRVHQADAHYFRTTMPVHIAHVLLQILLHRGVA